MDGVELVLVLLLVAVAGLSSIARRLGIPYPIVLVCGGAALGALPAVPDVSLDPDLVLLLFLPPLLYIGAFFADLRDLRYDLRPIVLLSLGLVLATVVTVAVVAHAIVPGLPWPAAFALGAIVGPTDPVAAIAIASRLGVPRRTVTILEGESLINDASALVAFRIAVAAAGGGAFSLLDASGEFAKGVAGGIAVGLAVGWAIAEVRRRIEDPLIENTIGLLSAYVAYVPAEHLHVSAVLAAVTCGIFVGWRAPEIASPTTRLQGFGMWELLQFLLNSLLFILVGLELPHAIDSLDGTDTSTVVIACLAVPLTVMATRMVWQHTIVFVIRAVDRRQSVRARRGDWRQRTISAWAGMRGAVSLAAALALPADFPQRDLLIIVTFAVIFATLVLQGLTLPWLIRLLGVHADDRAEQEELKARLVAVKAALARIDELELEEWTREETVDRMRGAYGYRKRRLAARAGKIEDTDGYEDRSTAYQRMVREVLNAQRDAVVRLRNEGVVSNDVMHRLERELDLEDERLEI